MGRAKRYDSSFKREAVELAKRRGNVVQVAKDLGVSYGSLRMWVKQSEHYPHQLQGVVISPEQEELGEMRKKIKELEDTNEVLRRAAAFFCQNPKL